ncbi:MAG: tetratricopeptide repeat protein [Bacteroidales bacterium]|nr:tetratricopeptide repeat protein [Bacteroidales bacterium]MCF8339281.1 tetratricopeptide repeat protein [Bacteroidales bacterium]
MNGKSLIFGLFVVIGSLFFTMGANAQTGEKEKIPKYGEDSVKSIRKLSLYQEFYDQWKDQGYKTDAIHDALKSWRYLFDKAPRITENLYIHGTKMYRNLIKKADDKERKEALIDTLMMVYDKRLTYFPTSDGKSQEGKILGYKGVDFYRYRPEKIDKAHNILKKSVEKRGVNSQSAVLVYYFRTAIKKVEKGNAEKELIVNTYDEISNIIDKNLERYDEGSRYYNQWETAKNAIESSFEPWAECEDLISIYGKKFEEEPENPELLRKITNLLDKKDCDDSDLYFKTKTNLYKVDSTGDHAMDLAKMNIEKEKYDKAAAYLQEAANLYEEDVNKADAYKLLARVNMFMKNHRKARQNAYKALDLIPKDGELYLMIGDMYAATAKECGNNDLTSKVAYWAAVDKYKKAKQIDETIADEANKRIREYKKHFPKKETIFFHDLNQGDEYEVGCWINETTTVRASD